jgi:hypothetical protein
LDPIDRPDHPNQPHPTPLKRRKIQNEREPPRRNEKYPEDPLSEDVDDPGRVVNGILNHDPSDRQVAKGQTKAPLRPGD